MLMIPIPNGETKGDCRINGQPCEFTIADGAFSFRPKGSDRPWDRRKVLSALEGETLTSYVCASEDGTGGAIFSPEAEIGADGRTTVRAKRRDV